MAVHGDNKLEEIQEAGAAIIGSVAADETRKPLKILQQVFAVAHDADTHRVQTNLVQQVWNGLVKPGQLSIRINGSDAIRLLIEAQKVKNEQTAATQRLLALLDEIRSTAAAIAAANENIAEGVAALKEEYGDDYIVVIAGSILTDDELAECETEDDMLIAMAAEILDEGGNLKPEYSHLDPAMIDVLKEVHDREKLKLEGAQLVEDYEQNGGEMTPELNDHAEDFGSNASADATWDTMKDKQDSELAEVVVEARVDSYKDTYSGGLDMDLL